MSMTKREPKQERRMMVMRLAYNPGCEPDMWPECDYCEADATMWHFSDHECHRDAYACHAHVGLLNRAYDDD